MILHWSHQEELNDGSQVPQAIAGAAPRHGGLKMV
jgi:hypothetical protein